MVGKIEIYYSPEVADFIDNLAHVLYTQEYFGFIEDANNYVDKLVFKIETNIHKLKHHQQIIAINRLVNTM